MDDSSTQRPILQRLRTILWVAVAAAVIAAVALFSMQQQNSAEAPVAQATLGGPFTLTDGKGQSFSSTRLAGKPYAIFFGFTRCGDVCPTTLGRLVKLRRQAGGDDAFNIVFVTIDPDNDGPKEVGQYAELFGSPIIGLTGSKAAIGQVKRQYGIYAEPNPQPIGEGDMMNHTSSVLLYDRRGQLAGMISGHEGDASAVQKLRALLT